ncbi:AraC family transcriptional regulator [Kordia antarctica]|uniref:AraC family transcriptional regulator n=1 Tax=Kordia antarctica TaxID=1218801 RepID=UPI00135B6E12|nr:AraC family transcriptional regulator [Kordia antarctica]
MCSVTFAVAQTDSLATKSFEELETLYISSYTTPKKTKKYVDALYVSALKGTDKQRIAKALYRKGYIYSKLGNSAEAIDFSDASLEIAQQINDSDLLLQNYTQKGNIYLTNGTYKKAIEQYLKAKEIATKIDSFRDLIVMTYNIGLVKKQVEDFPGALEDFGQNLIAIKSINSTEYDRLEIVHNLAIADTYLRMEIPDSALVYTNRGLQKIPENTYLELHTDLSLNKVIIIYQQQKYQQSIALALSLENAIKQLSQEQKFVTFYLYLGKNHQALDDENNAIAYFEKIKTLVNTEHFSLPELEEVYYHLAKMYFHKNDAEKATENFKLFETFTKENNLANKKVSHTIKDYDISTLKKELFEVNTQRKKQQKTVYYLYIIASILLSCIVIFFVLFKRNQRRNRQRFDKLLAHIKKIETPKISAPSNKQKTELAIDDEGVVQILKALEKFEKKQQFLHVDCNLSYTAKKLKTNTAYLSHVINTYKGQSFTAYLNELRINTALVTLKNNKKIRLYSIKAIAEEFGYARRETFSKVFKNITGMHPSMYVKELQKSTDKTRDNS